MSTHPPERADWQGVGTSFRDLGRRLGERASAAGGAISAANGASPGGPMDRINAAFSAAVAQLDATTTDPEIGAATRTATARLLDAIKVELTGSTTMPDDPPAALDPGPTT